MNRYIRDAKYEAVGSVGAIVLFGLILIRLIELMFIGAIVLVGIIFAIGVIDGGVRIYSNSDKRFQIVNVKENIAKSKSTVEYKRSKKIVPQITEATLYAGRETGVALFGSMYLGVAYIMKGLKYAYGWISNKGDARSAGI